VRIGAARDGTLRRQGPVSGPARHGRPAGPDTTAGGDAAVEDIMKASPVLAGLAGATIAAVGLADGPATAPAGPAGLMAVVKRYADAMIEHGRDVYGPRHTLLFLSALDRTGLKPLTTCPAPPAGVRDMDRVGTANGPLVGANLFHDENLLRLLYALSGITGEPRYREAADTALRWFFTHAAWPQTGLLPWGEHMSWQVVQDERASRCRVPLHEMGRPWMLWDRCWELAPEGCARFATGLWEHQIADHETGDFDRHAWPHEHHPGRDYDLPRHAGMYIQTWAKAYRHTQDRRFLHYIDVLLRHYDARRHPETGLLLAWANDVVAWPLSSMSMAIECHDAAGDVPPEPAGRLRAFGEAEDRAFLALDHDPAGRGFVVSAVQATGQAVSEIGEHRLQARTVIWSDTGGQATTAMVGLLCAARHAQAPREEYRRLILAAAAAYADRRPDPAQDTWPLVAGQVISLELTAHRLSGDGAFLDRARQRAAEAVRMFWQDRPLPRASAKTDHYETLTGADSLALALLEAATADTPAAALVPSNTIDR